MARPGHIAVAMLRLLGIAAALVAASSAGAQDGEALPQAAAADLIRYRILEREDFKNTQPPHDARRREHELAAVTCIRIRTDPNVSMHVGSSDDVDGPERFEGWLGYLRFQAVMDRACSWWNPDGRYPVEYTLKHEQIHFAIREIAARRLNQAAAALVESLHVTADTEQEVLRILRARVEELFNEHNDTALRRNRELDEQTSLGQHEDRQDQWWREIERELRETEAWR